jgi:hypothetical protein
MRILSLHSHGRGRSYATKTLGRRTSPLSEQPQSGNRQSPDGEQIALAIASIASLSVMVLPLWLG